jgi:hypothetical protein
VGDRESVSEPTGRELGTLACTDPIQPKYFGDTRAHQLPDNSVMLLKTIGEAADRWTKRRWEEARPQEF